MLVLRVKNFIAHFTQLAFSLLVDFDLRQRQNHRTLSVLTLDHDYPLRVAYERDQGTGTELGVLFKAAGTFHLVLPVIVAQTILVIDSHVTHLTALWFVLSR